VRDRRGAARDRARSAAARQPGLARARQGAGAPQPPPPHPGEAALRQERGEPIAVHLERDERDLLVASDPDTFFFTPHWASSPSVLVWLDRVDPDLLRELITDAWRARAPKRLVRELDGR
jgi:hypothetical protein